MSAFWFRKLRVKPCRVLLAADKLRFVVVDDHDSESDDDLSDYGSSGRRPVGRFVVCQLGSPPAAAGVAPHEEDIGDSDKISVKAPSGAVENTCVLGFLFFLSCFLFLMALAAVVTNLSMCGLAQQSAQVVVNSADRALHTSLAEVRSICSDDMTCCDGDFCYAENDCWPFVCVSASKLPPATRGNSEGSRSSPPASTSTTSTARPALPPPTAGSHSRGPDITTDISTVEQLIKRIDLLYNQLTTFQILTVAGTIVGALSAISSLICCLCTLHKKRISARDGSPYNRFRDLPQDKRKILRSATKERISAAQRQFDTEMDRHAAAQLERAGSAGAKTTIEMGVLSADGKASVSREAAGDGAWYKRNPNPITASKVAWESTRDTIDLGPTLVAKSTVSNDDTKSGDSFKSVL